MKIVLTGCAGFIGSHVCERLLKEGHQVTGIDNYDAFYSRSVKEEHLKTCLLNPGFKFIEADITDFIRLQKIDDTFDVVIHIAAKAGVRPSIDNPIPYLQTNVNGTQNLLEWMAKKKISKLIFASSSSVYGNNKKVPFRETDPVDHPISPYAATKKAAELINYTYHHLYHIDVLNLRFFTVYGPRQRPDLAIHKFVKAILNDQPITVFGDGDTARDYTHVDDTVDGVMSALEYIINQKGIYEIVNLGNSKPVYLKDLVHLIYKILNRTPNIQFVPMQQGDVDITFADISRAKELFGYNPKVSMEEGLKQFVCWYQSKNI